MILLIRKLWGLLIVTLNQCMHLIGNILPRNKLKRVSWISDHSTWRQYKWKKVIWTDEKIFAMHPLGKKLKVKILFDETPEDFSLAKVQQGGKKIMFWGAISGVGKIYFEKVEGNLFGKNYRDFLAKKFLPHVRRLNENCLIFQHDGAPGHRAKETKSFLEEQGVEVLTGHPSHQT